MAVWAVKVKRTIFNKDPRIFKSVFQGRTVGMLVTACSQRFQTKISILLKNPENGVRDAGNRSRVECGGGLHEFVWMPWQRFPFGVWRVQMFVGIV